MTVMSEGLLLNSNYIKMGREKGSLLRSRLEARHPTLLPTKEPSASQVGK